jgi:hypothetical protein
MIWRDKGAARIGQDRCKAIDLDNGREERKNKWEKNKGQDVQTVIVCGEGGVKDHLSPLNSDPLPLTLS